MRALTRGTAPHILTVALLITLWPDPSFGQTNRSAFRATAWGMSPAEIQSVERGHHLGSRPDALAGIDHMEAYFDVVRGKIGEIGYGFFEDRLVYGVYRFKLKTRDRAFSQAMGEQLRSTYGPTDRVEVSNNGKTIQLHWSAGRTTVIARFAPAALAIHFWDARHRAQYANASIPADGSNR